MLRLAGPMGLAATLLVALAGCGSSTSGDAGVADSGDAGRFDAAPLPDAGHDKTLCELYCDVALANCSTGNQKLYPDHPSCIAACAAFPTTGALGDTTGNSVYCRLFHAGLPAQADPVGQCPIAGPNGGGMCGDDPCDAYCDQAMAHCTGLSALYPTRAACKATCSAFPRTRTATAVTGDSVECRTHFASYPAAGNASVHCPRAAANGDGVCGSVCEAYCDQALVHCQGSNRLYPTRAACLTTCAAIPSTHTPTTTQGNNIECRLYAASFPSAANPALSCNHASAAGGEHCGLPCESYCDQVMAHCSGPNAAYPNRAACLLACDSMPIVNTATSAGDSVECRTYHASFPAATDPVMACPHASVNGGNVCGTPCEAYCDQIGSNCQGANRAFDGRATCMQACGALRNDGDWRAADGDSVQCRAWQASFPSAMNAALHCPQAGISGGNTCGSLCDVYCDLVMAHCPTGGPNQLYASRAACMNTCAAFDTTGASDAHSGDTVQCRDYYASFPAATDPNTHCPHAGASGGAGACQ